MLSGFGWAMWKSRARGSRMKVHSAGCTSIQTEYFPFLTGCPLMETSWSTSRVVAQLAPGVHTSPHGIWPP